MNVHKTTKTIRKSGFLNIQFLASFLRSTHPARPSLPASASRPVKIHVGEIKIIRSTGGTHLGDLGRINVWFCVFLSLRAFLRLLSLRIALRPAFLRALHFVLRPAVIARVSYCAAYAFCGTSRKGKRGATRGKRPWVFSPRVIRADECGRMYSRSALPEKFLELNRFLKI